jgi:hypothetical protein
MMSTVESAARVAPSPMITGPNARLEQAVEWEALAWVPRELLIDGPGEPALLASRSPGC